ncbi:MAG: 7-carboxy-7-deazaguanine synthase QueE [Desulfobulbaceae bacterium]
MHDGYLAVAELFYSLQGESTRAGLPCAFIRLAGCNLRCRYCDSAYTWEEPGNRTTIAEILRWLEWYPGVLVEITGGEPLLQKEIYPLLDELLARGWNVLIETNGSLPVAKVPVAAGIILDLKCPDSGMAELTDWGNIPLLAARKKSGGRDEIKFVLSSEADYLWAREIIARYQLAGLAPLLLSPVSGMIAPARLAELMLRDRTPARLQLQLHRLIWPDRERGV